MKKTKKTLPVFSDKTFSVPCGKAASDNGAESSTTVSEPGKVTFKFNPIGNSLWLPKQNRHGKLACFCRQSGYLANQMDTKIQYSWLCYKT